MPNDLRTIWALGAAKQQTAPPSTDHAVTQDDTTGAQKVTRWSHLPLSDASVTALALKVALAGTETITGVKTFNSGKLKLAGSTSGSTILNAAAAAGSGTVVLPTTGTLATLTGTETLSGKTIDLSGNLTKDGTTFGTDGQGGGNEGIMLTPQGSGVINLNSTVIRANTGDTADLGTVAEPFKTLFLGSAGIDIAGATIAGDGTGGGNEGIVITPDGTGDTVFASGNVGIGTASPGAALEISQNSTSTLFLKNTSASGATAGAGVLAYSDDGSALASGDRCGFMLFGGIRTGSTLHNAAGFAVFANQNWTASNGGSYMTFETCPDNSTTRAERMRIGDTGNVGINLTDPQDKLEIAGGLMVSSPTYAGATDYLRTSITTSDAGAIAITGERGGSQAAVNGDITITPIGTGDVVFASGNVIADALLVATAAAASRGYVSIGTDPTDGVALAIQRQSSTTAAWYLGADASLNGLLQVNGDHDLILGKIVSGVLTEFMTMKSGGNVGIGTTSPTALLEVQAAAGSPGEIALSTAELTVVATDVLGKVSFGAPLESSGTDAVLDGAAIWAVASDTFAADNNSTDLVFATAASETAAERMRIDSSGNVGIGTASPTSLLHLSDSNGDVLVSGAGGQMTRSNAAAAAGAFSIYTRSRGTTSSKTTVIDGDTLGYFRGRGYYDASSFKSAAEVAFVVDDPSPSASSMAGRVEFRANAAGESSDTPATRMTIKGSGNVGIGTTSPAQALDVAGSIVASGVANQIPIYTEAHAASHTIDAAECYGGVHYVTAASVVITLPPVAVGMSVTIVSETANMVDINPDGTEVINLDGTAAAAGENINSPGAVGDICVLTYRAANTWYAATNSWVEATP